MSKLHYTELFYSIQGEGRYTGVPSVFLRTFGCNFRCKNFGRHGTDFLSSDVNHNPEVVAIIKNLDQYSSFKDLPLTQTGCDSYSSIYPEFKKFVIKKETDTIATKIIELLPYKEWKDEHLVITGGEPLLGWQRAYPALFDDERMLKLKAVTFETNGTQPLHDDFKSWLPYAFTRNDLTFSVSAKLSCSGEKREDAIKPEVVCEYQEYGTTYLKLVIATEADMKEALEVIDIYRNFGFKGNVYVMPVGGVESVYHLNNTRVAEFAMKYGLRYSDRLQVPLFKNAWGT